MVLALTPQKLPGDPYHVLEITRGYELAVERARHQGHKIECLIETVSSVGGAARIMAEAAARHRLDAIVGSVFSSHALEIAEASARAGIPFVVTQATHPGVVLQNKFVRRLCYSDRQQAAALVGIVKHEKWRSLVILSDTDQHYSRYLASEFQKQFRVVGGVNIDTERYKASNLKTFVSRLAPEHSAVFAPLYNVDLAQLCNELARQDKNLAVLAGDTLSSEERFCKMLTKKATRVRIYYTKHWDGILVGAAGDYLSEAYGKAFGSAMVPEMTVLSFEAADFLFRVIHEHSFLHGITLSECIQLAPYDGPRDLGCTDVMPISCWHLYETRRQLRYTLKC